MGKQTVATESNLSKPERIIKNHMYVSMGFGAIPLPMVDMAGITGTQLSMISKLAAHYDVPFSNDLGKSVLTSLLGAVGSQSLATGTLGSAIKLIPGVGSILGAITYPAIAGATTYAVGNVFARHFSDGGTLADFKANDMKTYFKDELEKGKSVVKTVKKPFTKKSDSEVEEA